MVQIAVKNLQKKVPFYPQKINRLIRKILKEEGASPNGEITVSIVTDPLICKLNLAYSRKDTPTDVLAFNTAQPFDKKRIYADIIVSSDTAVYNAALYKTSAINELNLYITHGLLHLLGYSHNLRANRKIMRRKEERYVNT